MRCLFHWLPFALNAGITKQCQEIQQAQKALGLKSCPEVLIRRLDRINLKTGNQKWLAFTRFSKFNQSEVKSEEIMSWPIRRWGIKFWPIRRHSGSINQRWWWCTLVQPGAAILRFHHIWTQSWGLLGLGHSSRHLSWWFVFYVFQIVPLCYIHKLTMYTACWLCS